MTDTTVTTANNATANTVPKTVESTVEDLNKVSTGDLPWAAVLMPTTSSGMNGVGTNKHSLQPQDMVYGIFLDDDMQQPLILGVFNQGTGAGMNGSSGTGSSGGTGSGNILNATAGGDNAEKAYFLFIKYGYTPHNSAGIVGNLLGESMNKGDIDPNITERENGQKYSSRGFGIAQWTTPSRQQGLRAHAGNKYNTLEGQVSFIVHELRTTEGRAEKALRNASNDLEGSVQAFLEYERPAGYDLKLRKATGLGFSRSHEKVQTRLKYAKALFEKMQGKTDPGTSGGTTTPSTTPTTPTTVA